MKIVAALAVVVLLSHALLAQTSTASCRGLDGLIGEWAGTGGGEPGQASAGESSFRRDLQGKILVRRSFAEYPAATKVAPSIRHDDLMIVYDGPNNSKRANYWDNEGHAIEYAVTVSNDGCAVTFLSPGTNSSPGYRLTYVSRPDDQLELSFEIAPPGKSFGKYLQAVLRRKQ